jgi:hypothetical protein
MQLVHLSECFGATNCVDCWPYKALEVYQIVLIVCAFCLVVLGMLGVRAYFVLKVIKLNSVVRMYLCVYDCVCVCV